MEPKLKNPFCVNFTLELIEFQNQHSVKKSKEVTTNSTIVNQIYTVEKQKHTKLYHTAYDDKLFFNLNSKARDIILYILLNIKENEDFIELSLKKIQQKVKISKKIYYDGLKELKEKAFVANRTQGTFWINPQLIFNGNRKSFFEEFYPQNVVVVHTIYNNETLS